MDTNDQCIPMWYFYCTCNAICFVFGVVFMPFVSLYLHIHSFIYLSILSQFASLLRSFSSYETSQSVGVVKTGESREKRKKKKKEKNAWHTFKQGLSPVCTVCGLEPTTNTAVRRSNETR